MLNLCAAAMLLLTDALQGLDNPDQRLAQDLPQLTQTLGEVLSIAAAVPFNVAWYTYLTHQVRPGSVRL